MAGHSPGPFGIGGELILSADSRIIGRVSYPHHGREHVQDSHEGDANRALFATSDRMLAMLRRLAGNIASVLPGHERDPLWQEITALIAEAEGQ